jgi:hypothetical protein
MGKRYSEFTVALIFLLIFPLLPLLFEYWISGTITEASAVVVSSMYAFSIAFATRLKFVFAFALLIGVIFAMAFGALMIRPSSLDNSCPLSLLAISCFFGAHALERYKIHVLDGQSFLNLE